MIESTSKLLIFVLLVNLILARHTIQFTLGFDFILRQYVNEKCKNKCDTGMPLKSPSKGAQTALARMGVWGKDGNESFPRRLG